MVIGVLRKPYCLKKERYLKKDIKERYEKKDEKA